MFSTIQAAHVAELVDAADSKSAIRKDVKVRFLSWAPKNLSEMKGFLLIFVERFRDVAQPGSARRSGRRGRWFESSHPD